MRKTTVSILVSMSSLAPLAQASGFLEDSKVSTSARTLYFEHDIREPNGVDQRQTDLGLRLDAISGFTSGSVGFGVDVLGLTGINLGGGLSSQSASSVNTVTPVDSDGHPVSSWSRLGANVKAKISDTELKVGSALAPNLPVVVANDGRVLPQIFEGAAITSTEINGLKINAGKLTHAAGRASTNYSGLTVSGATKGSNSFYYAGADWKVTPDLMLQYYFAQLSDFYNQNFLGGIYNYKISDGQYLKTDIRYFHSTPDGRAGNTGYVFNNAGGYASKPGEAKNDTWSAFFTYGLGGHAFTLGHQRISGDGAMPYISNNNLRDGEGRHEGEGGSTVYLFTDSMINSFVRAGERTTFGQYIYDFAASGVPGLKASVTYLHGDNIKDARGNGQEYSEWERDYRIDYAFQQGFLKDFAVSLRRANYRSEIPVAQGASDTDQTRLYLVYTHSFK